MLSKTNIKKSSSGNSSNSEAQSAVNDLIKYLFDKGVPTENIEIISGLLVEVITSQTMITIEQSMDVDDKRRWEDFMKTNPNDAQQLVALDEFYKRKKNLGIQDVQNDITIGIAKSAKSQIEKSGSAFEKISQLTDEQAERALDLINKGDLSGAESVIGLNF